MALAGALIVLFYRSKSVLTAHKTEMTQEFTLIRNGLEAKQKEVVDALAKLNGDELSRSAVIIRDAAKQNAAAARRIEQAALAIAELIIPAEVKRAEGLAPNEYAEPEPGESFVIPGRTERLDQEAEREEGGSIGQGF